MALPHGAVTFLSGSPNRVETMSLLVEDGPLDQRAVADHVDASRRTAKRTLDGLADRGWVRSATDGYHVTALGEHVLAAYEDVTDAMAVADHLQPFLSRVDAGEFDLDPANLADATVVESTESSPYAPMDRVLELRRDAGRVRILADIVQRESADQLHERAAAGRVDAEVVVTVEVARTARRNPDYVDAFEGGVEADATSFYVYDGEFPFLLGLFDGTVALGVTDDSRLPAALVETADDAAVAWAASTFERYRDAARPLDGDD